MHHRMSGHTDFMEFKSDGSFHFGGTSLDLTDSDRSVIIQGILYKQESNSFYTSLYLKKTNLIQNSKKQSIDNVKATIKTEYLKQLPSDGDRLLIQGRLKQIQNREIRGSLMNEAIIMHEK